MKLQKTLGTGLIVVGGAVAGMYGTGCVDHYRKLDAACDETYSYMSKEFDESKLKHDVEINMQNTLDGIKRCRQYRQSGKPMTERMQESCNYFEESLRQYEEQRQSYEQAEEHYREKSDEAEKEWIRHADEFWAHTGITTLGLFVAAAGYAVRKSAQNLT